MDNSEILVEGLSQDESGLQELFDRWNANGDFIYKLMFARDNTMLVTVTEPASQVIEVYTVEIKQVV